MKKFIVSALVAFLILTGCGISKTETMSCNYKTTYNNLTTNMKYDIDYEGTEVKKVRVTYDYMQDVIDDTDGDGLNDIDGVGTGTDGTTNDTQRDNDGIVDGIVGNAFDSLIGGVSDVILDISGLKDRHQNIQNTYSNINGFSVQNTIDTDNNYKVTYVIDYDTITDNDLGNFNLSRNINTMRDNYTSQGFTCK